MSLTIRNDNFATGLMVVCFRLLPWALCHIASWCSLLCCTNVDRQRAKLGHVDISLNLNSMIVWLRRDEKFANWDNSSRRNGLATVQRVFFVFESNGVFGNLLYVLIRRVICVWTQENCAWKHAIWDFVNGIMERLGNIQKINNWFCCLKFGIRLKLKYTIILIKKKLN